MISDQIKIKDISKDMIEDLAGLCIPEEMEDDPYFIEGVFLWKKWIIENLERFGSIGKVAYLDSQIAGMIQYVPKCEDKIVEIKCSFVEKDKKGFGIRKSLLDETIDEFKRPKTYFGDESAKALVALTCHSSLNLDNIDFYKDNGFKRLSSETEYLLYFSLDEDYTASVTSSEMNDDYIDDFEKDKAVIFCNSHCPYCVDEMMDIFTELRKLDSDIPVRLVIPFEEPEEFDRVFSMPLSVVINGKALGYSMLDNEVFLDDMKETLVCESGKGTFSSDPSL